MMPAHDYSYQQIGPYEHAPFSEWLKQIESTPCEEKTNISARHMMKVSFEQESENRTHFSYIVCLDNDKAVGILKHHPQQTPLGTAIWIEYFAVLPSHQRRGIGKALLRQLQCIATKNASTIFGRPDEPAKKPLLDTGFWQLPKPRHDKVIFKWSDMPSHINDDFPWPDDD